MRQEATSEEKPFELTMRLRNNLLKSRRLALGLSCAALSEKAGVPMGTYCNLESLRVILQCANAGLSTAHCYGAGLPFNWRPSTGALRRTCFPRR